MKTFIILSALISTAAFAQQQTPQISAQDIMEKLGAEAFENVQLKAALNAEQKKNVDLQKRIDDLAAGKGAGK